MNTLNKIADSYRDLLRFDALLTNRHNSINITIVNDLFVNLQMLKFQYPDNY